MPEVKPGFLHEGASPLWTIVSLVLSSVVASPLCSVEAQTDRSRCTFPTPTTPGWRSLCLPVGLLLAGHAHGGLACYPAHQASLHWPVWRTVDKPASMAG